MMNLPDYQLPRDDLLWAVSHLCKYGDTDIFPTPPEYLAVKAFRDDVVNRLSGLNLKNHRFRTPRRISVPKVIGGYRVASQLEPDDAILYTALAFGVCQKVESGRIARRRKISCSYRIKLTKDGGFFCDNNGYDDYKESIVKNLAKTTSKYVLSIDISDFYNQISHHRIRNNLDSAGCNVNITKHLENCLNQFCSNHHSRGIPVGPSGSIILAEAALMDFDDWILREGCPFCRYVDDFRVFFSNTKKAVEFLDRFTLELYNSHRLSPNSTKTFIKTKDDFLGSEIIDEEELEEEKKLARLWEIISKSEHPSDEYEIDEDDHIKATMDAISELFGKVKKDQPLPLGLARFVLRRARQLRLRRIANSLLDDLDMFVPVIRDVVYYLVAVDKNNKYGYARRFADHFTQYSEYRGIPYIQEWVLYLGFAVPKMYARYSQYKSLLNRVSPELRNRYEPLIASVIGKWEVIRSYKEKVDGLNSREKRAIVMASCVLSDDEKNHWLSRFQNDNQDYTLAACAKWSKANKSLHATPLRQQS